ncbi:TerB N-terminal domain-containing protein [Parafannyhessea umbonata]|uniref:TerB N-terminal domain-containing protein n=1 Tax=Parafannyhessea umbonata TaxID=604330 RepID=UPI0026EAB25A|nr:TerB N-terminal domain-containing protein [Parafannyhessea umbonata]MDD7199015.1 TerB N-terminal domain-containing protein [Parafannyhessea umbonata]MDY4418216.1 TerB N-terminal domain-containing protein [Parafannyhessea umbonata]
MNQDSTQDAHTQGMPTQDGRGSAPDAGDTAGGAPHATPSRARRVIDQIMQDASERERAIFSQRTFGDEPILRTGADLRREREATPPAPGATTTPAAPAATPTGTGTAGAAGTHPAPLPGASGREERAALRRAARAELPPRPRPTHDDALRQRSWLDELDAPLDADGPSSGWPYDGWSWPHPDVAPAHPRQGARKASARTGSNLPQTLRELRQLETEPQPNGTRLTGVSLFVAQARLAASYEDDSAPSPFGVRYRYSVSYRDLSDEELRGYFAWRTAWRAHREDRIPYTYGHILAAELVNGIGAEPGMPCLQELVRLRDRATELDADGMSSGLAFDARRWIRDYAVLHNLPAELATTADERAFAQAVATLRTAERAVLCETGARDLTPKDMPAHVPTDADVWKAMAALSSYNVERSPFLRNNPQSAAAVGAAVFRALARHCGKRRKTNLVDGLVGWESNVGWFPFPDLPCTLPKELPSPTYRIDACTRVTTLAGRWFIRRGYEHAGKSRDLGRILRAMDRQMREDWDDPRTLKPRPLAKYLEKIIVQASAEQRQRELEAESRKITIDLSKLGGIRAAAATTREALLVDEEIEDEPAATTAPAPSSPAPTASAPMAHPVHAGEKNAAPSVANPTATDGTTATATSPASPNPVAAENGQTPCDLDFLELKVIARVSEGKPFSDLLGPGKPMASVLVDSINEKLFDELGDTAIEYVDGEPRLVPDYVEDVRDICGL